MKEARMMIDLRNAELTEETAPAVLRAEAGMIPEELMDGIRAMSEMIRITNERLGAMEESLRGMQAAVRTLEKVTPGQAAEINRRIRDRANEICRENGLGQKRPIYTVSAGSAAKGNRIEMQAGPEAWVPDAGALQEIKGAIRRDVREMTGVRAAREIPRCDGPAVLAYIADWEDWDTIRRIRRAK